MPRNRWSRAAGMAVILMVVAGGAFYAGARLSPAGHEAQAGAPSHSPGPSSIAAESEQALHHLHETIAKLARQVLASVESAERLENDANDQRTTVKSAERTFEHAKLAREVAEIGVVEYESGTLPQEKTVAQGVIQLAKSDLERARQDTEIAKTRLSKIKQASRECAGDLVNEYLFDDRVTAAGLRQTVATLAVEQAEAKLKVCASVGLSASPADGTQMHEIIGTADARMYAVKRHGRGHVRAS